MSDALLFILVAVVAAAVVYGTIRWLQKDRDDQIQHRDEHRR